MSTPAIWCRVVQSRDVSPHNFDGLAMSSSAFSVAPSGHRATTEEELLKKRLKERHVDMRFYVPLDKDGDSSATRTESKQVVRGII